MDGKAGPSIERRLARGATRAMTVNVNTPELPATLRYEASESFVKLLDAAGCSLAVSVYTAGRVALISAERGRLHIDAFGFRRPMGIASLAAEGGLRLAIATFHEVVILADAPLLAPGLPNAPGKYEHLLVPRASLYTGDLDAHDLVWCGQRLFAANTRFSCIAEIDARCSFTPLWMPPWIGQLAPDDRCHLNGLATESDAVVYATAFAPSDIPRGWSESRFTTGVLMEVPSGRVVLDRLCMPHSPRVIGGDLYVLDSGKGQVLRVDAGRRAATNLATLPGFARGLDAHGDVLFVGLSRLRDRPGKPPPIVSSGEELMCGIAAVDRRHGRMLGYLRFDDAYEELFDVKVLSDFRRGALLSIEEDMHRRSLVLPGRAFWGAELKDKAPPPAPPSPHDTIDLRVDACDTPVELVR
jgi:uncharacterized protein (TIGR03032 family)